MTTRSRLLIVLVFATLLAPACDKEKKPAVTAEHEALIRKKMTECANRTKEP